MIRPRQQKSDHTHYFLLANPESGSYDNRGIQRLIRAIRRKEAYYTLYEGPSAPDALRRARLASGLVKTSRPAPVHIQKRGRVTALVACGGDATINQAAQVALEANLPLGILPLGRQNNIARSLLPTVDIDTAIATILKSDYRLIDCGLVSNRLFISTVAIGLVPQLNRVLRHRRLPRFSFSWNALVRQAMSEITPRKIDITIDSYHFPCRPSILNITLLPYAAGLPFSTMSLKDDQQAEVIFNLGEDGLDVPMFVRRIHRRKHCYDNAVRLYRGRQILVKAVKDQLVYLDGELIEWPEENMDIKLSERQLKCFC
jgi:diacylglycerol kinase family enzyme